MKLAMIEHVAAVHDFYSIVEQRADWLYSWLPVFLSMLHFDLNHVCRAFIEHTGMYVC